MNKNKFIFGSSLLSTTFLFILVATSCTDSRRNNNHNHGQENAIWTESIYLRGYKPSTGEELTPAHIRKYANTLKENNFKYAYLFAGPYQNDGHLPSYSFSETAVQSVKQLQELYPEIVILPWVGGIQNKTVYLDDSTWVQNALIDTKKLIDTLNVQGVHIDFEYIIPGDWLLDRELVRKEKPGDRENYANNVNNFHEKLRELLPEAFISSVVVATSPDTKPWKKKTDLDELKVLVQYIDQLSFLYYDTFIKSQDVFERNCKHLIEDIIKLKNTPTPKPVQYLIAIGTFINVPALHKYRDMDIENIPNSILTIQESLENSDTTRQFVDGLSVFCDWQTSDEEWDLIREYWVGRE